MYNNQRVNITAISIDMGIITLIEPNGEIACYRQRGISKLPKHILTDAVRKYKLNWQWAKYKELPRNYSISFEDPEIMGRAYATFNPNRAYE